MSFINAQVVAASAPLHARPFPLTRGHELKDTLSWCATDYYSKAISGRPFEARGVMVIGDSRQGKTTEINDVLDQFNDGSVIMPDDRPGKILTCTLSAKVTWKALGYTLLAIMNYPATGLRDQSAIWSKVVKIAKLQGVVGFFFDECQHVFKSSGTAENQEILDCFKTLLKDPNWPLMLILAGVPVLATHVAKEEQLARLLRTVRFEAIDLSREMDLDELLQMLFRYAEKAGLDFGPMATRDFLDRLVFSCCDRWGLVIEILREAFTHAQIVGDKVCKVDHFSHAFAQTYSVPNGYSPFTMPNYRDSFDHATLMKILKKTK